MPPRFRRSPRLPRCDPPEHYDDPLGTDACAPPSSLDDYTAEPVPVITGLSDEEDALRHLRHKFEPGLGFCRNCEGTYKCEMDNNVVLTTWCPACQRLGINEFLCLPGTPPYASRHKI